MRHQLPCDACSAAGKIQVSMYRCPRCMRTSCSLACVKAHKKTYNCDGVRDRAAPVPKRDYTENHFMSDYSLLEDARRALDAANAARPRNYQNFKHPKVHYPDAIPPHRKKLLAHEAARRGIDLRFMPPMYLRHRTNSSNVKSVPEQDDDRVAEDATFTTPPNRKREFDRVMIWCMDIFFWGKDGGTACVKVKGVDEDTPMKEVLRGALAKLKIKKDRMNGKEDPYIDFLDLPPENISAFLKNESGLVKRLADAPIKLPNVYLQRIKRRKMADGVHLETYDIEYDTRRFNQMPTAASVRDSLFGRSIVEYPIIHAVVKGSKDEKQILEKIGDLFEKPEPGESESSASEESESESKGEEGELREDGSDSEMPEAPQSTEKPSDRDTRKEAQNGAKVLGCSVIGSSDSQKSPSIRDAMARDEHEHEETEDSDTEYGDIETGPVPSASTELLRPKKTGGKTRRQPAGKTLAPRNPRVAAEKASLEEGDSSLPRTQGRVGPGDVTDDDTAKGSERLHDEDCQEIPEFSERSDASSSDYDHVDLDSSFGTVYPRHASRAAAFSRHRDENGAGVKRRRETSSVTRFEGVEKVELPATAGRISNSREAVSSDGEDSDKEVLQPGQERKSDVNVSHRRGKKTTRSPPLPFAFELDSALLSDRIPRRKLANSSSLQTLKSC